MTLLSGSECGSIVHSCIYPFWIFFFSFFFARRTQEEAREEIELFCSKSFSFLSEVVGRILFLSYSLSFERRKNLRLFSFEGRSEGGDEAMMEERGKEEKGYSFFLEHSDLLNLLLGDNTVMRQGDCVGDS